MENAKKTINLFLKNKYSPNELKAELYKAGVAAMEEGWTFMDASFQLGGKARDDGMDGEEVEQILRRAFSAEKRTSERPEEKPAPAAQNAAPSAEGYPAHRHSADGGHADHHPAFSRYDFHGADACHGPRHTVPGTVAEFQD